MFVFRPRVPAKTAEGHEMPLVLSTETKGLGGCMFVCFFVFMSRQGKREKKEREWRSRREIRDLRCPVNTAGSNSRQSCHKAIDLAECL